MREKGRENPRERKPDSFGRERNQVEFNGRVLRKDFRDRLVSVFIDNLSPVVDSEALWRFFKPLGKIRDVYISSKKSFRGRCFGFIRLESVEEAIKVVKRVNGMVVFGRRVSAKVASYGWNMRRSMAPKVQCGLHSESLPTAENENKRDRSFADVVAGKLKGEFISGVKKREEDILTMEWHSQHYELEWLYKSAVGILKKFSNVSSVNERVKGKGLHFSSHYIGDKSVLWSFDSVDEKNVFINSRFLWDDCFSSVVNWSELLDSNSRTVWINVSGIPLCFWNQEFFMKIGWMIGEPLLVEEDTVLRNRFDRGRILVLIPNLQPCPNEVRVVAGKVSVVLRIEEDKNRVDFLDLQHFLGLQKKNERVLMSEKANQGYEGKDLAKVSCSASSLVSNKEDKTLSLFKSTKDGSENQSNNRLGDVNGMKRCSAFEKEGVKARCGLVNQDTSSLGNVRDRKRDKAKFGWDKKDKVNGLSVIIKGKGCSSGVDDLVGSVGSGDNVKKGVNDSFGGSTNKEKGEVSCEVELLGSSGPIGGCVGPCGGKDLFESLVKGDMDKINVSNLDSQDSDSLGSCIVKKFNDVSKMSKGRVSKDKVHNGGFFESGGDGHSIKVFGSNDGSSGGVAVSGNQVVYINFEKGGGLLGSGLRAIGGPAIDLYVDLGDLDPLFQKGKMGEIGASMCPSERRRKKKDFFPSRIHRMKTRSGARVDNG